MKRGPVTALLIAIVTVGWIVSGQFEHGNATPSAESPEIAEATAQPAETFIPSVRVRESVAQPKIQEISLLGRTEADRTVDILAETDGLAIALDIDEGQFVNAKDVIVKLALNGKDARVRDAESQLAYRKVAFEAAEALSKKNYKSEVKLAEEQADLSSAYASLAIARVELARTKISVPFGGLVGELYVEQGKSVQTGDLIVRIDDLDPIIVVAQITEYEAIRVERGQNARIALASGKVYEGVISYIARTSDELTRTFQIKMRIDNPELHISAGLTADVVLYAKPTMAHRVSPAVLTLNDEGRIGVKTVDDNNVVNFFPIRIVADTVDGIWITGLPEKTRVISVGHEFVLHGQTVNPVISDNAGS